MLKFNSMKRLLFSILPVFILLILPQISVAKVDLKLHLNKNTIHTYVITQENQAIENGQAVAIEQKTALTVRHKVIERLSNGNYSIELKLMRFSILLKNNNNSLWFDSDTVDVANPLYKTLKFLTDIQLNYEVSPGGIVSNLKGFDSLQKEIQNNFQLGNFLQIFGNELFYKELYNYLPAREVEVGMNWKSMAVLPDLSDKKYEIQYTLKEVTPENSKLALESVFKLATEFQNTPDGSTAKINENGTLKGTMVIDSNSGMRLASQVIQSINLQITPDKSSPNEEAEKSLKIITQTKFALLKN
jgi:hypothetical protein